MIDNCFGVGREHPGEKAIGKLLELRPGKE